MAVDFLITTSVRGGEYYSLVLFATSGMMMMAAATDLIVIFSRAQPNSGWSGPLKGAAASRKPLDRLPFDELDLL